MTDDRTTPPPSEAAARQLVQLGEEAIRQMMDAAERAKELLASGSVPPFPGGMDPHGSEEPYPWETSEPDPEDAKRVWFAAVNEFGTGEVLSVYFAAALVRDEDEFRRCISAELGRKLANMAEVRVGVYGSPLPSRFLPPTFVSTLEALDRGEERPATMSFLVRYRAKHS